MRWYGALSLTRNKEIQMRTALLATALAFSLTLGTAAAHAADKVEKSATAEKSAKKPAAGEVTLSGDMVCGKCTLHETKKCQNVLKVTEGTKETKYYLADNGTAKENHGHVCSGSSKATVKGSVSEEGGKKVLTASEIKYQ